MSDNENAKPLAEQEISWGDYKVVVGDLPEASILALMQRGFTHVMGNEVASSVSTAKAKRNEDGSAVFNDAELAVYEKDKRDEKFAAIMGGQLGVRAAGVPKMAPLDKLIREIALAEIRAVAAAQKKSLPRKAEELEPFIAKRLEKHGDRIRAAAEARIAELKELADDEI